MKTNYFTKIENKYVFNLSLIFWHLFIALSTLATVVFITVFLWSIIPASERRVEKQTYPEKTRYPEPVKVSLSELTLSAFKQEEALPIPTQIATPEPQADKPVVDEDTKGKYEYLSSFGTLRSLIPPSKYSWIGSGYWSYPNGDDRYWKVYKQERYRQWNKTEDDVEDKLLSSYQTANALNYTDKKQLLDGYITVIKLLPEEKRLSALKYMINNVADNVSQNINFLQSLIKVVSVMSDEENNMYIDHLALLGKNNPNDISPLIDYISTVIEKFDKSQRSKIIISLIDDGYNGYFNRTLPNLKEATDLFITLLPQIGGDKQSNLLLQYFGLYSNKNYSRNVAIARIENEYQQKVSDIDIQHTLAQGAAKLEYEGKKETKQKYRYKSLMGIGMGILLIVLIATMLVFFSIQRSVSKIEEKIDSQNIP